MNFIELKLVNIFHSKEEKCNITINPLNITHVKVENDKVLVRTKLGREYFYISKDEYEEKVKPLFKNRTLDLSFGKIFIKDIECYWNVDNQYCLQMSWTDVRVDIKKDDYDKIVETFKVIKEESKIKEFTKVGVCYNCKEGLTFTGFDKDSSQAIYKCKSCGNVYNI
jgi:hypothetical protein